MNAIKLELDGAHVEMRNLRREPSAESIVLHFTTTLHAGAGATVPARECLVSLADLRRMAAYVRSHVGANSPHSISDSNTFVTYDLGFQLQALSGELESWKDGYFTIRWMFYCGPSDRSHGALYVGVEARVAVAAALRWADALDELATSRPTQE
jgi:hypothetical protein